MPTSSLTLQEKRELRARPFYELTMPEKYQLYDIDTIGYLDIESSGLTADFDIMLSYAVLVRNTQNCKTKMKYGVVNRNDFETAVKKKNADLIDKRIVTDLVEDITDIDLLIGHWFIGKHRHDIPFIRTRCVMNQVPGFPHYKKVRYGDTQKWGSTLYRLHNNGLDSIANMFGVHTHKTRLEPRIWKNACIGVKDALDYVLDHNIKDAKITHQIHKGMEEWVPIPATYW
jgi:uncharacterized protein YprB with RNaseH-like and TPR domain